MRAFIPVILAVAFGKVISVMCLAAGMTTTESVSLASVVFLAFLTLMLAVAYIVSPLVDLYSKWRN